MPTSYTDQFYTFDPANPPSSGTSVNFVSLVLTDQNDDGDIDRFNADSVNGSDVTASYPGDTVTINVPGVGNVTYTGITFYLQNGSRVFTPTDGQVLANGTLVSTTWVNGQGPLLVGDLGPPCFVSGTLIRTPGGDRLVEDLQPGDLVETRDRGAQPLKWVGARSVPGLGDFAPVRLARGALGNIRTLFVSPQHRILLTGWRAELFAGQPEVLAAATHLVNDSTIRAVQMDRVTYHHIMFDRHEVIEAEGLACESLFPGDQIMGQDRALRGEIEALFPELAGPNGVHAWKTARRVVKRPEARLIVAHPQD